MHLGMPHKEFLARYLCIKVSIVGLNVTEECGQAAPVAPTTTVGETIWLFLYHEVVQSQVGRVQFLQLQAIVSSPNERQSESIFIDSSDVIIVVDMGTCFLEVSDNQIHQIVPTQHRSPCNARCMRKSDV